MCGESYSDISSYIGHAERESGVRNRRSIYSQKNSSTGNLVKARIKLPVALHKFTYMHCI